MSQMFVDTIGFTTHLALFGIPMLQEVGVKRNVSE